MSNTADLIANARPYDLANWNRQSKTATKAWRRQVPVGDMAASMLAHFDTCDMITAEVQRRSNLTSVG